MSLGFAKRLAGCGDGSRDIGATFGNNCRIQFVEGIGDRIVIQRERSLQKCGTGESDKPDSVALKKPDQILREKFGTGESGGRHVRREHAARSVDGHNHIAPFLLGFFFNEAVARLCERHDGEREGRDKKRGAQDTAQGAHRSRQLLAKAHSDDFCNKSLSSLMRP